MKKIVITGSAGLIGHHVSVRLHAKNCAERFAGRAEPYALERLTHADFQNSDHLRRAVQGADAIMHFAGVNRAPDDEVQRANPDIANALVSACRDVGATPHIVYANSTHYLSDTPYGRSKRIAHEIFARFTQKYTNLVLPHIFGEGAKPYYNNVTATFIDQTIKGETPSVNRDGRVELLHAGAVADLAISAFLDGRTGEIRPPGKPISVGDLLVLINEFHADYSENVYPMLDDDFRTALFNSYRNALYPSGFPRPLRVHADKRGSLFEAVKGGGGGQTFLSWTEPGVTRGDHFHLGKVERFLVLEGEAIIRMRPVLKDEIWEYRVDGKTPAPVDMPTLHTHSIQNVGDGPLLTLFWTNEIFDPANPDTYADQVLKG